jgi:hypothetical protein
VYRGCLCLSHSELAVVCLARLFRDAEAAIFHSPKNHKALTLQVTLVRVSGLSQVLISLSMICFAVILTTLNATSCNTWPRFNSRLSTLYNALGVIGWLSECVSRNHGYK